MKKTSTSKELIIFKDGKKTVTFRGDFHNETLWASQAEMAEVFGVNSQAVTKHIRNIYAENELQESVTCSKMEQVRIEGSRTVKRTINYYNLDVMIAVGYRISSVTGSRFRQWATKTIREHITKGFTINRTQISKHYDEFMKAVGALKALAPVQSTVDTESVLELVRLFADTWFSLDAYDKEKFKPGKVSKKHVKLTADELLSSVQILKEELVTKGEATENFAQERRRESVEGIVYAPEAGPM